MSSSGQDFSQYHLAAIVESAEDAIISKTLEGTIVSWNEAAERVYGYPAMEIIGKHMGLLIPLDRPHEEEDILKRIGRGERIDHFETERVRKSGERFPVSLTVFPIRNGEGKVIAVSHIARDITQQKDVEQQRLEALDEARKARQEAEFSNRVKDEFLATISHELRTPLTAVLGWVRMLRAGKLDVTAEAKALEVPLMLNADKGFESFLEWKPEILISDIGLPDVDGYEFIRRIREYERPLGQKIPAVALTAFARIEDRVKSLAAGYQMHVAKPVEPGELLTIVASLSGFIDRR